MPPPALNSVCCLAQFHFLVRLSTFMSVQALSAQRRVIDVGNEMTHDANPPDVQPSPRLGGGGGEQQTVSKTDQVLTPIPSGTTRNSLIYGVVSGVLTTGKQRTAEVRRVPVSRSRWVGRACINRGGAKATPSPRSITRLSRPNPSTLSAKGSDRRLRNRCHLGDTHGLWHQLPKDVTDYFVITITDALISADLGYDVSIVSKPGSVRSRSQSRKAPETQPMGIFTVLVSSLWPAGQASPLGIL